MQHVFLFSYLPGTGTSQTKAFFSEQGLSAQPDKKVPFDCMMQFSDVLPLGSPCSHSEKGIADPSSQTYRPSLELSCNPIQASDSLDANKRQRKNFALRFLRKREISILTLFSLTQDFFLNQAIISPYVSLSRHF